MTPALSSPTRPRPAATLAFWRDLLLVGAVTASALYFGRGLLIPLSVALLLFVLLASLSDRITSVTIRGRTVPKWLAHLSALVVILLGLAAILSILSSQIGQVGEAFPRYQARFSGILEEVLATVGEDNAAALQASLENIKIDGIVADTVSTGGAFLSALFLVLLYIPFMMLERKPMIWVLLSIVFGSYAGVLRIASVNGHLNRRMKR